MRTGTWHRERDKAAWTGSELRDMDRERVKGQGHGTGSGTGSELGSELRERERERIKDRDMAQGTE